MVNMGQETQYNPAPFNYVCWQPARSTTYSNLHLKIVTGTYILQSNRSSFNQNEVDPTCLLCKTGAETLTRFLLHFATLESIRQPILTDIKYIVRHSDIDFNNSEILLQLLTDCSAILDTETVSEVIFHVRRLCHALHVERYQRLSIVPRRKRKAKNKKKRLLIKI